MNQSTKLTATVASLSAASFISIFGAMTFTAPQATAQPSAPAAKDDSGCKGVSVVLPINVNGVTRPVTLQNKSCDATPTNVEYTGQFDNHVFVYDCLWTLWEGKKPSSFPRHSMFTVFDVDQNAHQATGRILLQHQDTVVAIKTSTVPGVPTLVEAFDISGKVLTAQSCDEVNIDKAELKGCTATRPFVTNVQQSLAAAESTEQVCSTYVGSLAKAGVLTNDDFNWEESSLKQGRMFSFTNTLLLLRP